MSLLRHCRHFIFYTRYFCNIFHIKYSICVCVMCLFIFSILLFLWCELLLVECALIYSLVFKFNFNWCGVYGPIDRTVKQTLWTLIWFVRVYHHQNAHSEEKYHQNFMISIKCYLNFEIHEIETEIVTVIEFLHQISIKQKIKEEKQNWTHVK